MAYSLTKMAEFAPNLKNEAEALSKMLRRLTEIHDMTELGSQDLAEVLRHLEEAQGLLRILAS